MRTRGSKNPKILQMSFMDVPMRVASLSTLHCQTADDPFVPASYLAHWILRGLRTSVREEEKDESTSTRPVSFAAGKNHFNVFPM